MPIKISATIITFNEASNIKACLTSLQPVVDEIILVDSFSTDETITIARQFNCSVFRKQFINFLNQKEFADNKATNNWVLNIDADELLSPALQQSILQFKRQTETIANAYKMNRLNYIGEKPVKCCGWYPDKKLRLYRKDKVRWAGGPVHAFPKVENGTVVENLAGDLIHYSYKSKTDFIERQIKYAKAIAIDKFYAGKRTNLFKMYGKTVFHFLKLYLLKGGILNREFGFFLSKGLAKERYLREQYLWDLQKRKH